jgi:hypothetical protein
MPKFAVTFEGQLMDPHMTKLGLAEGVEYEPSSTLMGRSRAVSAANATP